MKNLKSLLILALISSSLFSSGCDLLFLKEYYVDADKFSIRMPSGWYEDPTMTGVSLLVRDPKNKEKLGVFQANINVFVRPVPTGMTFETYFEANKDDVTRLIPPIGNIEEGRVFAGIRLGRTLSYESNMQNVPIKFISAVWFINGKAYVVTCTAGKQDFMLYQHLFHKVLSSLRVH
jgi:hypothetical protein